MSLHAPPDSLVCTVSILSAFISRLLIPVGQPGLGADLTQNLLTFSPVISGVAAAEAIIGFIGWRTSRIADTHSALDIIGRLYFDARLPGKKRLPAPSSWRSIGRRGFLLGVTLPSYILLLKIDASRWMKFFVTCLITEAVLVDVFLFYVLQSSEKIWLRREWPAHTFLGKGDVKGHALPLYLSQTLAVKVHRAGEHPDTEGRKLDIGAQPQLSNSNHDGYNLCEILRYFWATHPELPPNGSASLEDMDDRSIIFIVLSHVPRAWKCSHYRCLAHYIRKPAQRFLVKLIHPGEMIWIIWLLHRSMKPFAIWFARLILSDKSSSFIFNIFKFMVFHAADWFGLVLFTVIFYQVFNVLPGFNMVRRWFLATPRICQWVTYGVHVLCYIIFLLKFLRPAMRDEAVLPYVIEVIASPMVLFTTYAAWGCITRLLKHARVSDAQNLASSDSCGNGDDQRIAENK